MLGLSLGESTRSRLLFRLGENSVVISDSPPAARLVTVVVSVESGFLVDIPVVFEASVDLSSLRLGDLCRLSVAGEASTSLSSISRLHMVVSVDSAGLVVSALVDLPGCDVECPPPGSWLSESSVDGGILFSVDTGVVVLRFGLLRHSGTVGGPVALWDGVVCAYVRVCVCLPLILGLTI